MHHDDLLFVDRGFCLLIVRAGLLALLLECACLGSVARARSLSIDDVLGMAEIDQVVASPDGRDLAVVVRRPADAGETFGRASYEIDPSRSDVWLVHRDGSGSRNLTDGRADAAGFWCAQWSPDGSKIAVLSTQPEGKEPRGGDSVRLYLLDIHGRRPHRLDVRSMMTQTRYGSPINALDLRGGAISSRSPQACNTDDENSPFLWLDSNRLLVIQMPDGQNSALFTQNTKSFDHFRATQAQMRAGLENTADVSDTDPSVLEKMRTQYVAEIAVINTETGKRELLGKVPAFPFRGMLSAVVSPDLKSLAVLSPRGTLTDGKKGSKVFNNDELNSVKVFTLIPIDHTGSARSIVLPAQAAYPVDIMDWSPDSRRLVLRARETGQQESARFFVLDRSSGVIAGLAPNLNSDPSDSGTFPHEPAARWLNDSTLHLRGRIGENANRPDEWWRVAVDAAPTATPQRASEDRSAKAATALLIEDAHGSVWEEEQYGQRILMAADPKGNTQRKLLILDPHLEGISWGKLQTIDYASISGRLLKALVILPPDYQRGTRYPTLFWVYPGTVIKDTKGFWSELRLPGIYNLQLYAAKGYAIVVPSMPVVASEGGPFRQLTDGVLPAIDKVIELGIAAPNRLGVFGQSFGGYATYGLVAQTNRFGAGVAISGSSELLSNFGAFDSASWGWRGASQDKSAMPVIARTAERMGASAVEDPQLYVANSPANYAAAITTPLLMIHGQFDIRGTTEQAEIMFTLLSEQNKQARLLRYAGEGHGMSLSPANVRSVFNETVAWFDKFLKP